MSQKYILRSDYRYGEDCVREIEELHIEFKRVHKRATKIDLTYSLGGTWGSFLHELVARYELADEAELDFFKLEMGDAN